MNAVEIEEAISILAEQPFDAAEFPYAFLEAFGNKATEIQRLRKGNSNKTDIEGAVLQAKNIHLAISAKGEVFKTLEKLKASPATLKQKAKFILATDGEDFQAEDLTSDAPPLVCKYSDFPNHFGFFLPLAGISTVKQIAENTFDIRATSRLNRLYVELLCKRAQLCKLAPRQLESSKRRAEFRPFANGWKCVSGCPFSMRGRLPERRCRQVGEDK